MLNLRDRKPNMNETKHKKIYVQVFDVKEKVTTKNTLEQSIQSNFQCGNKVTKLLPNVNLNTFLSGLRF